MILTSDSTDDIEFRPELSGVVKVADGNYVTLTEEKKYTRITFLLDCPILKTMSSAI